MTTRMNDRFFFHAPLIAVLLSGATARAEDSQPLAPEVAPQAQDVPRQPNMDVVAEHIGQFQNIWNEHDRKNGAENTALNATLVEKYAAQRNILDEPQLTMNPGETIEEFKQRSLDFSARWATEHGKPRYRTEDGLASFVIDGISVTKEEYLAYVEMHHRQMVDRKKALDDFTEQTRFGIKPGEAGYDDDSKIVGMKDDVKKLEEHLKEERQQMEDRAKTYQLPKTKTLISDEVGKREVQVGSQSI